MHKLHGPCISSYCFVTKPFCAREHARHVRHVNEIPSILDAPGMNDTTSNSKRACKSLGIPHSSFTSPNKAKSDTIHSKPNNVSSQIIHSIFFLGCKKGVRMRISEGERVVFHIEFSLDRS